MGELRMDLSGLDELDGLAKALERAPELVREARRQVVEEASGELERLLDQGIAASGLNDSHGRVRGWQGTFVGTRGGYVAIRPKEGNVQDRRGRPTAYSIGQVTNAIERGHPFRKPSGRPGYRPRIKLTQMSVPGRPFYKKAASGVEAVAQRAGRRLLEKVKEGLSSD